MKSNPNRFVIAFVFLMMNMLSSPMAMAETNSMKMGIVIMHGKGGSPSKHVSELASALEAQGMLVANLEMPWSGKRNYDVNVAAGEAEVETALNALRAKGARKLFVAGHSQGGLFALYFGNKHVVDGIIAIAPGGNVAGLTYRDKVADSVEEARKLIAEGKSDQKTRFTDFEGNKGSYPVTTTPASYLTWFDPEGAMNETQAVKNMNPATPVLFVAPTNDYSSLVKIKQQMFDALPKNPRSKLYEPDSSHINAPTASIKEIIEWVMSVAKTQ